MNEPEEDQLPPMAIAMQWTSRITTVSMEMVLPGIGGQWLDERWGTELIGPLGFVFGVTLGMWHLIQMTKVPPLEKEEIKKEEETNNDNNHKENQTPAN